MKSIKTLSALAVAALGVTALTTSSDASALSRLGASWRPYHCTYSCPPIPPGAVGGTNKWTCKQNGEGCYRQK